mmetsp:Transcript_11176/g.31359  ORF Transcript_11176/g.31359 Transcript_11176/m.31359 type:complete len:283 (-) Transcript_11176:270-1118(-)
MTYRFLRTACRPASWQMEWMSAALILSGRDTKSSRSTSSLRFILLVQTWKMRRFCRRSGRGNSILRSSLPGRSSAGSSVSARLVAMMTLTFTVWSKPSIWLSSSMRMRWTSRSAPVCASKRAVAIASTSSMKMMAGAFSLARRNTSLTILGPSPRYFCTNSLPTTRMNEALVWWATALASMVLPVPGGPYSRTPRGGSMPICEYSSWCVRGSSTASRISCFCTSLPPMSAYVTSGFSWSLRREMEESASGGSTSTRLLLWRCRATDAEGLSSSRFTVLRIRT